MSSTARVSRKAKARLRRIRDQWAKVHAEEPSQEALIDHLTEFAEDHLDQFIREADWKPASEAQIRRWKGLVGDYGHLSTNIDEIVYGS